MTREEALAIFVDIAGAMPCEHCKYYECCWCRENEGSKCLCGEAFKVLKEEINE